jgi:serine/threonine-protein kinase
VLDFGISKMMSETLTTVRGIMGSPAYMSPEQIRSPQSVDARADIWAIGIVLYEMLTGITPFNARTLPAILTNIATQPVPSVRRYRLDVPARLDAVIQKCLEKDPADRYASAAELADALAPFVRHAPSERSVPPVSSKSSLPFVFTSSRASQISDTGAGPGWLGAAAAVLIALVGVLGTLPQATSAPASHAAASNGAAVTPSIPRIACPSPAQQESVERLSSPRDCDDSMTEPGVVTGSEAKPEP